MRLVGTGSHLDSLRSKVLLMCSLFHYYTPVKRLRITVNSCFVWIAFEGSYSDLAGVRLVLYALACRGYCGTSYASTQVVCRIVSVSC